MKVRAKIGIILLFIFLVLFLATAVFEFYCYQQEKLVVAALNKELESLRTEKSIADEELEKSEKKIDGLSVQLQGAQEKIGELNGELEKARSQGEKIHVQLEELQSQIQDQQKAKEQWAAKQGQIDQLKAQLEKAQTSKGELKAELDKLKTERIALGKIVVAQEQPGQETAPSAVLSAEQKLSTPFLLEGRVLVVNRKYDFVVIDLGANDRLKPDEVLRVYHRNNHIGDIRVERVQEAMSACGFLSKTVKKKIKVGNKVTLDRKAAKQKKAVKPAPAPDLSEDALPVSVSQGEVLVVNRKYNFAIVNLGARDGLRRGEMLSVYRNGNHLGDIRIDKIQEIISSCVFKLEALQDEIKEGDKVVKR